MDERRFCIDGPFAGRWLTASGDMVIPVGKNRLIRYVPVDFTFENKEDIALWVAGERSLGRIVECLHDIVIGQ